MALMLGWDSIVFLGAKEVVGEVHRVPHLPLQNITAMALQHQPCHVR